MAFNVHEKALERGVKVSGATVHFVDEGTDTWPYHYAESWLMVEQGDTPEVLQRRIMEQAEWKILTGNNQSDCEWKGSCRRQSCYN